MLHTRASSRGVCSLSYCLYWSCYSGNILVLSQGFWMKTSPEPLLLFIQRLLHDSENKVSCTRTTPWFRPAMVSTCRPVTLKVALAERQAVTADPHITLSIVSLLSQASQNCAWDGSLAAVFLAVDLLILSVISAPNMHYLCTLSATTKPKEEKLSL